MLGQFERSIASLAIAFMICSCSSAQAPVSPASSASPAIAQASPSASAEAPDLELCRPADVAPAEIRSKPGYAEFAVSVADSSGAPIRGLKQSDFVVQSGPKPDQIVYFRETSADSTPVSLIMVGDIPETMHNKMVVENTSSRSRAQAAVGTAIENLNACAEIAVVVAGGKYPLHFEPATFGMPAALSDSTIVQDFTTNHSLATEKMFSVAPSGSDHLPDALSTALAHLKDAHYPQRSIVIVTDGLDQKAIDESVAILAKDKPTDVQVWVIGIGDATAQEQFLSSLRGTDRMDAAAVKRLAAAGGGHVLLAEAAATDTGASLAKAITTIVENVAQGYAIGATVSEASKATVSLAKPAGASLQSRRISPEMLTELAALPPPRERPSAVCAAQVPPEAITSKPGYEQMTVSVIDASGSPVGGLKQSDFSVTCGASQCPVDYFRQIDGATPASIVIAIDTSGSMQSKLANVRSRFEKLLRGLNPCDEVGLIAFSSRPFLLQPLTTDHGLVQRRLGLLHAHGQTSLYDAILESLNTLSTVAKYRNRALIVVTDGMDNTSAHNLDEVLATVNRDRIPIYTIGIGDAATIGSPGGIALGPFVAMSGDAQRLDRESVERIGSGSGGLSLFVSTGDDSVKEFSAAVAEIDKQLKTGYEIGLVNADAAPPTITIPNHANYTVRVAGSPASSKAKQQAAK